MREIIITELTQALQDLARGFAHYLPRLIVMLIVAFVGWVIAYLLKVLVREHPAPDKVFQALGELWRHPTAAPGGATLFDGTAEPVCLSGWPGSVSFSWE